MFVALACASGGASDTDPGEPRAGSGGSKATGGASSGGATSTSGGTAAGGSGQGEAGKPNPGSGGTSGTNAGTGGSSGSSGETCGAYDRDEPIGGWDPKPAECGPNCMRVRNHCPFPLWIKTGLSPDNEKLEPGGVINVATPAEWISKRVTAYKGGPEGGGGVDTDKVEMNFSKGEVGYNVTYVDWVALPSEILAVGGNCNPSAHKIGCYVPQSEVLDGCPDEELRSGDKCIAPRSFCMNPANHSKELCKRLDPAIQECIEKGLGCPAMNGDPSATGTPAVYGCNTDTAYASDAKLCAALNRGMLSDPDLKDRDAFYKNPPYNTYSAWMQCLCPGIYTFSYDDVHEQGGFRSCSGNELRITWCPGDTP